VTVCIQQSGREAQVFVVDPLEDRDELYRRIVRVYYEHPRE
jgi:hypothetical protein